MNAHTSIGVGSPYYAGKVPARRAIEIARTAGIDVGGFEMRPDGTIAIYDSRTAIAIAVEDLKRK